MPPPTMATLKGFEADMMIEVSMLVWRAQMVVIVHHCKHPRVGRHGALAAVGKYRQQFAGARLEWGTKKFGYDFRIYNCSCGPIWVR